MDTRFDIPELRRRYSVAYIDAVKANRRLLAFQDVEDWYAKLNKVEARTFEDLRSFGIPLYPIFPFSDDQYIHFANPFKMIGVEIVFKNSPVELIKRKMTLLASFGWTMFTINSENTYHTIEEFFRIKRKDKKVEWTDLGGDLAYLFAEKYHKDNAPCLLYYLWHRYFIRIPEEV